MNPNQIAITPEGRPVVGTILEDKILGTEQTIRVQSEALTIPLIRVSRTTVVAEAEDAMTIDISAGAQYPGSTLLAINPTEYEMTLDLGGDAEIVLAPAMSQEVEWTGTAWRSNFSLLTGGSDNEEKFLRYGEAGPEWYSATPVGPSTADDLPDGETKGITTLAGKTAADDIGAATGATTTAKIKGLVAAASAVNDGVVELATAAEIVTGTDTGRAVTPGDLKSALALDGMWLPCRSKMPDGDASPAYAQDAWANTDGWDSDGKANLVASGGTMKATANAAAFYIYREGTTWNGKTLVIRARASKAGTLAVKAGSAVIQNLPISSDYAVFAVRIPLYSGTWYLLLAQSGTIGDWFEIDWIWVGVYSYLVGTLSEEAAGISNQLANAGGYATKAQATLTSTGTAPSDGDTVTIAGKSYMFKTVLGTTEGQILIGASAAAALDNLKAGVNSTGVSAVQYCATQNALVEATTNSDTTQLFEARTAGLLGNQIAIAESSSQLAWANPDGGTSALSRGTDDATQKILTSAANYIAGGGTRPAAAKVELSNTNLIGYENTVDVASGGTFTLPSGGTWIWNVYGYAATISSAKRGSSAGGTTLTVAGANASVGYRRYA